MNQIIQELIQLLIKNGFVDNIDIVQIVARVVVMTGGIKQENLIIKLIQLSIQNIDKLEGLSPMKMHNPQLIDIGNIFVPLIYSISQENLFKIYKKLINKLFLQIPQKYVDIYSILTPMCNKIKVADKIIDQVYKALIKQGYSNSYGVFKQQNFCFSTSNQQHIKYYLYIVYSCVTSRTQILIEKWDKLETIILLALKANEVEIMTKGCCIIYACITTSNSYYLSQDLKMNPPNDSGFTQKLLFLFFHLPVNYLMEQYSASTEMPDVSVFLDGIFIDQNNCDFQKKKLLKTYVKMIGTVIEAFGIKLKQQKNKYIQQKLVLFERYLLNLLIKEGLFDQIQIIDQFFFHMKDLFGEHFIIGQAIQNAQKLGSYRCIIETSLKKKNIFENPFLKAADALLLRFFYNDLQINLRGVNDEIIKFLPYYQIMNLHPTIQSKTSLSFLFPSVNYKKQLIKLWCYKLNSQQSYINLAKQCKQEKKINMYKRGVSKLLQISKRVIKNIFLPCTTNELILEVMNVLQIYDILQKKEDRINLCQKIFDVITFGFQNTLMTCDNQIIELLLDKISFEQKNEKPKSLYAILLVNYLHCTKLLQQNLQRIIKVIYTLITGQIYSLNILGKYCLFKIFFLLKIQIKKNVDLEFKIVKRKWEQFLVYRYTGTTCKQFRMKKSQNDYYLNKVCKRKEYNIADIKNLPDLDWILLFQSIIKQPYLQFQQMEVPLQNELNFGFQKWQKTVQLCWGSAINETSLRYAFMVIFNNKFFPNFKIQALTYIERTIYKQNITKQQMYLCCNLSSLLFSHGVQEVVDHFAFLLGIISTTLFRQTQIFLSKYISTQSAFQLKNIYNKLLQKVKLLKGSARNRYHQIWGLWISTFGRWARSQALQGFTQILQNGIKQSAQSGGVIQGVIFTIVQCWLIIIETKDIQLWVQQSLDDLLKMNKIIKINQNHILQRNEIFINFIKQLSYKLQEQKEEKSQNLKIYSDLTKKFIQTLSVNIFNQPLYQLFEPIIKFVIQKQHQDINEEQILVRMAEAQYPQSIYKKMVEMLLNFQVHTTKSINKKLTLLQSLLFNQSFCRNKLITIPCLPPYPQTPTLKTILSLSTIFRILTQQQQIDLYKACISHFQKQQKNHPYVSNRLLIQYQIKKPDQYYIMIIMALILIMPDYQWIEENTQLKELRYEAVKNLKKKSMGRGKIIKQWGSHLIKQKLGNAQKFGDLWQLIKNIKNVSAYIT